MAHRVTEGILGLSGSEAVCFTVVNDECDGLIEFIGLAVFSALITLFFVKPLTTDGMDMEDREVCNLYSTMSSLILVCVL